MTALAGTGVSVFVIKLYGTRILRDIEEAVNNQRAMDKKITAIEVKIDALPDLHRLTLLHDRQIIALQAKLNGKYNQHSPNGSGRGD